MLNVPVSGRSIVPSLVRFDCTTYTCLVIRGESVAILAQVLLPGAGCRRLAWGGGAWGLCGCLAQGITASGIRGLRLVGGVRARVCVCVLTSSPAPSHPVLRIGPCTLVLHCLGTVLTLITYCTIVLPVLCLVLRPDSFIKLPEPLIYSLIWYLCFVATSGFWDLFYRTPVLNWDSLSCSTVGGILGPFAVFG